MFYVISALFQLTKIICNNLNFILVNNNNSAVNMPCPLSFVEKSSPGLISRHCLG